MFKDCILEEINDFTGRYYRKINILRLAEKLKLQWQELAYCLQKQKFSLVIKHEPIRRCLDGYSLETVGAYLSEVYTEIRGGV